MNKELLIRMLLLPNLRSFAAYFSSRDADSVGSDDRIARLLENAAQEIELYLNEKSTSQSK